MIIDISNVSVTIHDWRREQSSRGPRHIARFTATLKDGSVLSGEVEPWSRPFAIGPSDLYRQIMRRDDDVEITEAIVSAARSIVPRLPRRPR